MAIETLTLKRFGLESDVWAFGWAHIQITSFSWSGSVYMWEILAYGGNPWEKEGVLTKDIRKALIEGRRLGQPEVRDG